MKSIDRLLLVGTLAVAGLAGALVYRARSIDPPAPMKPSAQVQAELDSPLAGPARLDPYAQARAERQAAEQARHAHALASDQRCVHGIVVTQQGGVDTPAKAADGQPLACSGQRILEPTSSSSSAH